MHCMANSYLSSWTSYGGGICGTQPPAADFSGTPTTWGSPSTVVFTDLSAPASITFSTSSPNLEKSADMMDGAIL